MRFGVVGLGWAARAFHLPALKQVAKAEVVAGFDLDASQRESWTRETGIPTYATLDDLLTEARPDVVLVGTPPDSHAELCLEALEGGAHVVCEKPFASNLVEADAVLAAAARAGRQVAVNHEFREKPIFQAVKQRIDSGELGGVNFCQVWQLMDLPPWDEPVPWRAAMPNRTLFEGGMHLVDLMLHFFSATPDAVYARHSAGQHRDRDADAIHLVTLEFPGGLLAQLTIDRLCPAATRYVEVRVDCERASLRASLGGRASLQIGKKRGERAGVRMEWGTGGLAWSETGLTRQTLERNPRQAGMRATATLMSKVVDALEQEAEPPSSGREARDALAVVEAAYRSSETGERITLGGE